MTLRSRVHISSLIIWFLFLQMDNIPNFGDVCQIIKCENFYKCNKASYMLEYFTTHVIKHLKCNYVFYHKCENKSQLEIWKLSEGGIAYQDYFTHFDQSQTLCGTKSGYHQFDFLGRNPLSFNHFHIWWMGTWNQRNFPVTNLSSDISVSVFHKTDLYTHVEKWSETIFIYFISLSVILY